MPLKKQTLKSRPEVKVTFEVDKKSAGDASQIFLLGEFNNWEPVELQHFKNGKFKIVVNIPTDQQSSYEYKLRLVDAQGSERFENDAQADSYRPNEFGEENSVVEIS